MSQVDCGFKDSGLLALRGPTLFVDIGFDPTYNSARPSKVPGLPATRISALIDTGASSSCIDAALALQLNLPVVDQQSFGGIAGLATLNMHLAQIHSPEMKFTLYGLFAGVGLAAGSQHHSVLIGRDFLRAFKFVYDGTTGAATLIDPSAPLDAPRWQTD